MVSINPQRPVGKWCSGFSLDIHTVSSVYLGVDEYGRERYDNTRSAMGELLYKLKYNGDASVLVAEGIGAKLSIPVIPCVTATRATTQLKDVLHPGQRKYLLQGLYTVDATLTRQKNILLSDDLFRSGATMNAITEVLCQAGDAAGVFVLTLTRPRSSR